MKPVEVLLLDDDDTFRGLMVRELRRRGFFVTPAGTVAEAVALLGQRDFNLALVDLRLPDGDGLDVLRAAREAQPSLELLMLTGHGTIDSAITAMRLGAFDYLRKPCPIEELEALMAKALERQQLLESNSILRSGLAAPDMGGEFVGESPAFHKVCQLIERVGPADSTVLILGETGVGKDMVAKLLHNRSPRRDQPMVVVECATLHEELLHSELFGHERGAYTGATQLKHGLFEVAHGGTIFLDEIGDVSMATQVKLLRVLETGCFRHVGGTREIEVDVRILAATNRDLQDMMQRGFFRTDLFYRLSTIRVDLPPLRERPSDIPLLAHHHLARLNARFGRAKRISPAAVQALVAFSWPGNVRELIHVLEHAVILSDSETVEVRHLPPEVRRGAGGGPARLLPLQEVERQHILGVLEAVDRNRNQAARILGISERTLYRKLREYGVDDKA